MVENRSVLCFSKLRRRQNLSNLLGQIFASWSAGMHYARRKVLRHSHSVWPVQVVLEPRVLYTPSVFLCSRPRTSTSCHTKNVFKTVPRYSILIDDPN